MSPQPSAARPLSPVAEEWHARPAAAVAETWGASIDAGLAQAEAERRLEEYGPNLLAEAKGPSAARLLIHQFASLLIYVLLAAAGISLLIGDILESISILIIAVLNALLGFFQEFKAEKALQALRELASPSATVLRGGMPARIPAKDVVPGDVLLLEAGDVIAADGRLAEATSLGVSEALLTGESVPVEKSPRETDAETGLAERSSMVYQGTLVSRGRGLAVVVATGQGTEMGRIAALVSEQEREETPLQRELAVVGRYLVFAAGFLSLAVFVLGVLHGIEAREMFLTAASLAVAAIPEGLPAAATIVLALGVQRMARRHVIIRRLSSVETLGSVTTIFTDKTGTLTLNRMSVQDAWTPGAEKELLRVAVLCNNASLGAEDGRETGDPTEVALLAYARTRGLDPTDEQKARPREMEIPFDASRARMTVVVRAPKGRRLALVKGAPEVVVARAGRIGAKDASKEEKEAVLSRAADMAGRGMRVLAFAERELPEAIAEEDIEEDLTFVGLIGLADPIRPEAGPALDVARSAGIHVVMLTGDQPATAASIGRAIGLDGDVVTGRDIEELALDDLRTKMAASSVFARVTSDHKLRIIQAAREVDEIVAMTGDGVNDAPALKAADIGIAMGRVGTDVAREASDMVLTDDNFSSIVAAVEEGRGIHANIGRFIHFLLSCNTAEVAVIFIALAAAGVSALTPLQILFVNLLTDGLPALALGFEPVSERVMLSKPRPRGAALISARSLAPITGVGGLIAASTLAAFAIGWAQGTETAQRLAFATLVGSQLGAALVFRSETTPVFRLKRNHWLLAAIAASIAALLAVFHLSFLRAAFDTGTLSLGQWALVAGLSLVPLIAGELVKLSGVLPRLDLTPPETT